MPNQQRLEGTDLEALLAKVRSEYGDSVAIVEANKLRRGGLGGFFAKESYEVVVDVDDAAAPATPAPATPAAPAYEHDDDNDDDNDEPFIAFSVDDLAASIDDPTPTFTTEVVDAPPSTESFAQVLGRAIEVERATALEPAWPAAAALADAAPAVARRHSSIRTASLRNASGTNLPDLLGPMAFDGISGGLTGSDLRALAALGVPAGHLALPSRTDDPTAVALVRLLEGFPAAPAMPRATGSIIAVLGDRHQTAALVAELAGSSDAVVVAGTHRGAALRSAADVDAHRRAWRRRKRPVVVAIDAPFGIRATGWAASLVDALEPSLVLGQVDAGRKPEDVVAWSAAVGGLDALAIVGIDGTTTPASMLATGIPIASIDDAPATPARWAALLTDRLMKAA